MRTVKFTLTPELKRNALLWGSSFPDFVCLNYNQSELSYAGYSPFASLLAVGSQSAIASTIKKESFEQLKSFLHRSHTPIFGYLAYDLKNDIEKLQSQNPDYTLFPDLNFFVPTHLLQFDQSTLIVTSADPEKIVEEINTIRNPENKSEKENRLINLKQRISKDAYLEKVEKIKTHLLEGDIYELNLCMEFFAENVNIDPVQTFLKLTEISPAPFSVFLRNKDKYLISASPERFLKKEKSKLLSQPIKGTARRSADPLIDEKVREELRNSEKERSENMMIVDLVRNDLAKSSVPGSVKVDELFGIYTLPQVHQMISTVTSTIQSQVDPIEAIKNAFPMGSMTGAPKIRAMELIEKYEESKRGLFSGAVGYITPEGDFDFNVVIRSLIYNSSQKYLSFHTGSAITFDSDPEKEYEECLLKGKAIRQALGLEFSLES